MFGISSGEFVVLLVVVVIFLGPKHAAQAVTALRSAIQYARQFSAQLRSQFTSRSNASLSDLGISEDDIIALRELRAATGSLDPRAFVRKAVSEEMDAWFDLAPNPPRTATNVPSSGQARSLSEIQKEIADKKAALRDAEKQVESAKDKENIHGDDAQSEPPPKERTSE